MTFETGYAASLRLQIADNLRVLLVGAGIADSPGKHYYRAPVSQIQPSLRREIPVRFRHRVKVNTQLHREPPDGGKRCTWREVLLRKV